MNKAFFLDRDGVINKDYGYVHSWDKFEIFDNTYEALRLIKQHGYMIVVITNQAGIARGYYTEIEFHRLMDQFRAEALAQGVKIDGVYHCPHHPLGVVAGLNIECDCRKPKPGMITRAADEFEIDISASYLVGDKLSDIQAGLACGIKESFLIGKSTDRLARHVTSLFEAVKFALSTD